MATRARARGSSRDPEQWARATETARATRDAVAEEVAQQIAAQVKASIVSGDIMGGRSAVALRLQAVAAAERRGDERVERASWLELAVASALCVAAIDFEPPRDLAPANGASSA